MGYPPSVFIVPCGYPLSAYSPPVVGALSLPPIVLADRLVSQADAAAAPSAIPGDLFTLLAGDDPIDAAIAWQFTVRQGGGAALGDNGHRLHTITKATPQAPVQLADEARRVVQKFIDRGQLANVEVAADVIGGSTATGAIEMHATNTLAERAARLPSIGGE